MSKHRTPSLQVCASCRGEGVGYLALYCGQTLPGLHVEAQTSTGDTVPCTLLPVESTHERRVLAPRAAYVWIVVIPLLERALVVKAFYADELLASCSFSPRSSRVTSRLLTHTSPHAAEVMRGFERRQGAGTPCLRIREVWPHGDGKLVWRLQAEFPVGVTMPADDLPPTDVEPCEPSITVFDARAHQVEAHVVRLESQMVPNERCEGDFVHLLTYSCVLAEELDSFYVLASCDAATCQQAFAGMNAPRARGMLADTRHMTAGASADAAYEQWFLRHRVTAAELDRQRMAYQRLSDDQRPLVSIVMPVYRPHQTFLEEAIQSVIAQSYERWELIIVNVSGDCPWVDEVLERISDARVRVLVEQNLSIAHNTNVGILAAQGAYVAFLDHDDVLEADALWRYMCAARTNPEVDLIYCDEDHLRDGHVHAPAFKTFPNFGKLYTHNYVTHFLMVSSHVLEHTARSDTEVSGAQDYDLTLKAFEVARLVLHIPHVLYHWREHAASTSDGAAQKPYAHEAGRAALSAHLTRRGIQAQVDDGPLPYTYRVHYDLPDPLPKVSIVIPTRDHAELLETCVLSILDKSTYQNLEMALVENNSVCDRTFELYDELRARDARVRVITWRTGRRASFNYSAVVNYGVRHSDGEYVIVLNNDTEVIEPGWIEELLGCLMRPEVGVVGAKLLFGDGLVQHVGMVANPSGGLGHACQNLAAHDLGPGYANALPGDYAMVTGACHMMRRTLFEELSGYDETFAVGYNDGDFCLRAREAGYAVTVAPYALLYHREFATRGREVTDKRLLARHIEERGVFCARHAEFLAQGDPALNPNTDPYSLYGELGR